MAEIDNVTRRPRTLRYRMARSLRLRRDHGISRRALAGRADAQNRKP